MVAHGAGQTAAIRALSCREPHGAMTQRWEDGALVSNEPETAGHSYRDELIEIHRAAEDNGTAGRES
jgi:hypothetical protein